MGKRTLFNIEIRGTVYPTVEAAAEALSVTRETIRRAIRDGRLDTVGLKSRPVTVHGRTYPSLVAAARANNVRPEAIGIAMRRGTLHRVGTGRGGVEPMRVRIRGRDFPDAKAAARHFGVKPSSVRNAILQGNPDRIGARPQYGASNAEAITIGMLTFPSKTVASLAFGYSAGYLSRVQRVNSDGMRHRVLAASMRLSDAVAAGLDFEAICGLLKGDRAKAARHSRVVVAAQLYALGHRHKSISERMCVTAGVVSGLLDAAERAGIIVLADFSREAA